MYGEQKEQTGNLNKKNQNWKSEQQRTRTGNRNKKKKTENRDKKRTKTEIGTKWQNGKSGLKNGKSGQRQNG